MWIKFTPSSSKFWTDWAHCYSFPYSFQIFGHAWHNSHSTWRFSSPFPFCYIHRPVPLLVDRQVVPISQNRFEADFRFCSGTIESFARRPSHVADWPYQSFPQSSCRWWFRGTTCQIAEPGCCPIASCMARSYTVASVLPMANQCDHDTARFQIYSTKITVPTTKTSSYYDSSICSRNVCQRSCQGFATHASYWSSRTSQKVTRRTSWELYGELLRWFGKFGWRNRFLEKFKTDVKFQFQKACSVFSSALNNFC